MVSKRDASFSQFMKEIAYLTYIAPVKQVEVLPIFLFCVLLVLALFICLFTEGITASA